MAWPWPSAGCPQRPARPGPTLSSRTIRPSRTGPGAGGTDRLGRRLAVPVHPEPGRPRGVPAVVPAGRVPRPDGVEAAGAGKLKELLHYDPPACDPRPEVVAKVDRDGYVRETVPFNTTPDIRVPAYVLVPKGLKKPAPGIVALHDHGGMYFWGREKIVEVDGEHPVLAEFKRGAYGGKSIASELARHGYVVIVIDMFYWGERRMLLDDDPADWRERPATSRPSGSPRSTAAHRDRSRSSAERSTRRASPGRG